MSNVSSFSLANNGAFMVKILIHAKHSNGKEDSYTSSSYRVHNMKTVNLKDYSIFKEGDTVWLEAYVVGGKNRLASEKFIFTRNANANAKYSVKGTTLITKNSLKFEGLEILKESTSETKPTDPVEKALYNFEKSSVAGCWGKILKQDVVNGLKHILHGTDLIHVALNEAFNSVMNNSKNFANDNLIQGAYPICGSVALMYDFAHRNPEKFVKCVQDLYEKGYFEAVKGHEISASKTLRSYAVNYNKYKNLDRNSCCVCWMFQATICQNMNVIFKDIDPDFTSGAVTMSSLYSGIKKMCTNLLGYKKVSFKSPDRASYIKDTLKPLWLEAIKKKGTVFMLYSANNFEDRTGKFQAATWHWVPCYDFTFQGDNLSIVYHTWGSMRRSQSMPIEEFSTYYSSCVIAY